MSGERPCPQCQQPVPAGFKFCGNCGYRMDASPAPHPSKGATMYFGAFQMPGRARLVLIKGSGQDGTTYYLSGQEHVMGRIEGSIRPEQPDPFLSPRHANFYYDNSQLMVRDEGSTNGVFVRIRGSVPIQPGDLFMVGKQLLRLDSIQEYSEPRAEADGTYLYYTPHVPAAFVITRILQGGIESDVYRAEGNALTVGRSGNTVNFPSDPFISGNHARIEYTGDGYQLTDLNSRNGTFCRIQKERHLVHGDFVFIGQQLFRVEIT